MERYALTHDQDGQPHMHQELGTTTADHSVRFAVVLLDHLSYPLSGCDCCPRQSRNTRSVPNRLTVE